MMTLSEIGNEPVDFADLKSMFSDYMAVWSNDYFLQLADMVIFE